MVTYPSHFPFFSYNLKFKIAWFFAPVFYEGEMGNHSGPVIRMCHRDKEIWIQYILFRTITGDSLTGWRNIQKCSIRRNPVFPVIGEIGYGPILLLALGQ
jgi:hypothetical protein